MENENAPNGNVSGIARSQLGTKITHRTPLPHAFENSPISGSYLRYSCSMRIFLCSIEHSFKKTPAFKSRRRAPFLSIMKGTTNKIRPFRFDLTQKHRKCVIRPSLPSKEELALVHMGPPVVRGVCRADRTVLSRPRLASSWFWTTICWPLPLGFGLDGCLLLERRGRVCV